jgi:hypothetical protein
MYFEPDKQRLSHLRLDGYPPQAQLVFCPRCDFQYPPQSAGPRWCPQCDAILHLTTVTRDLIELVQARAA